MTTVSIIGNRPQLLKLIPELADTVLWTGQHYSPALRDAYTKQIDKCGEVIDVGQTELGDMTDALHGHLMGLMPDLIAVYGDTDSTLAGVLAAMKFQAGYGERWLVHVEAGLRCGNLLLPEERNRIAVDWLSTFNFMTTEASRRHATGFVVGDIMQERLYEFWQDEMGKQIPSNKSDKWICTVHRAENSGDAEMMSVIKNINTYVKRPRIFLHPKGEHLFRESEKTRLPAIESAITYHQMMKELWNCEGVITDSGGLMREAAWLGKPCIVLRNECEFPELVEANRIKLVGRSESKLRDALEARDWGCKVELENPNTTQRILDHLGIERKEREHEETKS
jgi:UDP-GlcNAc3NAcA epimerase